ncbi:MAG: penicillin acylase family protein [Vicinamibacterales bacterium]
MTRHFPTGVLALLVALAPQGELQDLRERARAALAATSGEVQLAGLEKPVEVVRDRWGVPHIYAQTVHDLFFAQGYVAAGDRLWQLEIWRRIATGRLAEILGPSAVSRDIFARLLRYRGDMDAEWRSYRPDAKAIVEAFVEGINARVAQVNRTPAQLPIEFQLTGTRPEPWTPEVVVGRMAGYVMTRNARTELQRALLARRAGPERFQRFLSLDPPTDVTVPRGLDLSDMTEDVLALAAGASETADFSPLRGDAAGRGRGLLSAPGCDPALVPFAFAPGASADEQSSCLGPRAAPARIPQSSCLDLDPDPDIGSNNWVVSGALTATGAPLLANDPHRSLLLPSLRYTVHLNGPGWNVIGAGEPALPGVAAGHNDRIAFGFTIVGIDQQDLYVERLDPADPERYLYKGRSEPMRIERERIRVKGEEDREVTLRFTVHGPVLRHDPGRRRAYALRWVGAEPGAAGYLMSIAIDTATSWSEFLKALEGWKVPSENLVYADVDGNIGWVAAGAAPIRKNWNGLLPVPGHEGRYEWDGFLEVRHLPRLYNPKSGFIATANHNILPPGYTRQIGYEFSAPYRFARTREVLMQARTQGRRFSVADFERLQHDELSVVARALCDALRKVLQRPMGNPPPGREVVLAAKMLAAWDGVLSKDSAPAALYELWFPRLAAAFQQAFTPQADREFAGERMATDRILALVQAAGFIPGPAALPAWVDGTPDPMPPPARFARTVKEELDRTNLMPSVKTDPRVRGDTLSPLGSWGRRIEEVLLGPALAEAWREAASRMGSDPSAWSWGTIHRASFRHPLAFTPALQELMNTTEVPRGGDGTTPNATGSGARQTSGASFREVIDLGNWDRSTTTNVPGISGQPGSPHYSDLLPLWAEGRYHPMVFSREAVEREAESKLRLVPSARSGL